MDITSWWRWRGQDFQTGPTQRPTTTAGLLSSASGPGTLDSRYIGADQAVQCLPGYVEMYNINTRGSRQGSRDASLMACPALGCFTGPSQRARWARWGRQMREIRGTGLWLSLRLACRLVSLAGWPGPRYNVGERRWWRCARVIPSLDPGGEGRALCTLSGSRETAIWRVASQGRPGVLNNTEFAALANSVMTGSTQRGLKSGLAHFRCLLHESICRLAGAASPVPTLSDTFLSVQSDTPTPKRLE